MKIPKHQASKFQTVNDKRVLLENWEFLSFEVFSNLLGVL